MEDTLLGIILGLIMGLSISYGLTTGAWKADAVQKGYAQYCADTGAWAWSGECKE
jgi:hypothetical protein